MIYDGAHNPNGIASAVENIKCYLSPLTDDGKTVLLMGVMADKEHGMDDKNAVPAHLPRLHRNAGKCPLA